MTETIPDPGPAESDDPWHIQWLRARAAADAAADAASDRDGEATTARSDHAEPSARPNLSPLRSRRGVRRVIALAAAGAIVALGVGLTRSRSRANSNTTTTPSSAPASTRASVPIAPPTVTAPSTAAAAAATTAGPTSAAPTTVTTTTTTVAATTTTLAPTTTTAAPPTTAAPESAGAALTFLEGLPTELLPGGQTWPHALYVDSKLHMQGAVPSREVADAVGAKVGAIIGPENVVDELDIDPAVPLVRTVIVRLGPIVLFEPESNAIKSEYLAGFDQWASLLQQNPGLTLTIIGYTDPQGIASYNLVLAKRRAEAARARILANDIDPERVDTLSRGAEEPIASNATSAGRAQNRRIEFAVTGIFG